MDLGSRRLLGDGLGWSGSRIGVRATKDWDVAAGAQVDLELAEVLLLVVVLSDALANLCRGDTDDRVVIGVVVG